TCFGYDVAKQFGLKIVKTRPGLVPLVVANDYAEFCKSLSGISIFADVSYDKASFRENILFTHKGVSGPAILQISSYLKNHADSVIKMDLLPHCNLEESLANTGNKRVLLSNFLNNYLPNRFVEHWCVLNDKSKRVIDYNSKEIASIAKSLHEFELNVAGTEGYLKAEVTVGGVDTKEISSKTMESLKVSGLFFVGEVVDVTGWLGGYNFQWAWSSGFAAGSYA
ncbi:MAG: NAD(P)/FAD-dependent oxidoreductase, partial [Candidatus Jidaibacter sp.]|nr:NAD(P)/FAD-dependent oxidoreductase [Candidatus Jidaibacter sp.]